MNLAEKKIEAFKVTIIGSILDLALGVFKIVIGMLFFSHALVVDGIHSLSDLLTDAFVLIVAKYSHDSPDEEHPYGHARFETLGTVVIGIILLSLAIILVIETGERVLLGGSYNTPSWPTLVVAGASIISKELIYRYTKAVGEKINSPLILANAWHSRSDAFTSILVFTGIIFSMNGYSEIDAIMAVVLSVFIGKIGWDFIWKSLKELVDTGLNSEEVETIKTEILKVDGVQNLHNLRSRKMGDKAILDVNIEVSPRITVSEGHEIASWVTKVLIEKHGHILDVTVHTDVEDDRGEGDAYISHKPNLLPLRTEVEEKIKAALNQTEWEVINRLDLHYHQKQISLELLVSDTSKVSLIREKLSNLDLIKKVEFITKV